MEPGCNRHHLYYPRRAYKTKLERQFRQLPCHVVVMDIKEHYRLHREQRPPAKPKVQVMQAVLKCHRLGGCPKCQP